MFDEENHVKVPEQVGVLKWEKKRVRLTVGVKPEDDRKKKKRVPNEGAESRDDMKVDQRVSRLRQHVADYKGG